ncbi:MAG: NAD-dependent deacylase [Abditibacteriota bacterium]|nr:NAD-dependent deacylase [Abditibacteriota bacterium]
MNIPSSLADKIKSARNVFVFTGAGVSKESGLSTFRGDDDSIWNKYDPEINATPEGFYSNPALVWNFCRDINLFTHAKPNPGHLALAQMESYYDTFTIVTQNVDCLHEQAGSTDVVKIHGTCDLIRCTKCGHRAPASNFDFTHEFTPDNLPKCEKCGALYRPDIVWFGEYLPEEAINRASAALQRCDLMYVIGTSGEVSGGYGFAQHAAAAGATVVEINPKRSSLTYFADYHLAGPSGEILPLLLDILKNS